MADGDDVMTTVTGTIQTQLGDLYLEAFTAVERMSEPFRISCEVVTSQRVYLGSKLGGGASVTIHGGGGGGGAADKQMARSFHGLLMEASEVEEFDGVVRYALVLRPWFTLLQLNRKSRIFQHMTARDIIAKVFNDASIDTSSWSARWRTRGTLTREYCVQYQESDFNFVSRLMEEEGIYYFFEHTADKHVMVLCDGPASHSNFSGGDVAYNDENAEGARFWSLTEHVKPTPTVSSSRDTHFKKFGDTYDARQENPDASRMVSGEIYNYPGTHSYLTDDGSTQGSEYAQLRLQAAQAERKRYLAEGNAFAVSVGVVVNIVPVIGDHVSAREEADILVTSAVHSFSGQGAFATGGAGQLVLRISVEGTPSDTVWLPLLRTPKPVARGPQVATVAGPADDPIHTDAFGRVRVQFPWDRDGKFDDGSSCWLRVSTSWAGPRLGEVFLPRVGTEVIVDFLEGDMDRPFVSGSIYDNINKQPVDLPAKKTISGWCSQTVYGGVGQNYPNAVEPPTGSHGYNVIAFDDQSGSELVAIRAQRDMKVNVYRDELRLIHQNRTEKVGYNLDLEVQTGDETRTVTKGKRTTTIQKDDTLEVKEGNLSTTVDKGDETHTVSQGKRTTSIHADESLTVTDGNRSVSVQQGNQSTTISMGNMSTEVNMGNLDTKLDLGNVSMKTSTGTITYEAMQSIEFKVGANSIKIDMTGVTINGMMVKISADAMGTFDGGGMAKISAAMVMIN